jgi:hypothetical protein
VTSESTKRLLAHLEELRELAAQLSVESPAADFDVGLTTDDMTPISR